MNKKDKINMLKRVFDKHEIKRLNFSDEFYMDLLKVIEEGKAPVSIKEEQLVHKNITNISSEKMELMVNIEGICNELKGKTNKTKLRFGVDVRRLPLQVFLTESNLLIRDREFTLGDIIVFYDDTTFKVGSRGFAITRDEVITNISGIFRVFRFQDFTEEVEYVRGHQKDALRLHLEDQSFDIKIKKNVPYMSTVFDILNILYQYGKIVKKENKK
jgi:hypothetical protein